VGDIEAVIPCKSLVEEVSTLITPTKENRLYRLIIGENGTGKTSLLQLAADSMNKDKPKGVAYIDFPLQCSSEIDIADAMRNGLGWGLDPVIDSSRGNYSSSLLVSIFFFFF
jgi:ABC-type enterochelin transport system ATPase subunit